MHPAASSFQAVRDLATPLEDESSDYDELLAMAEQKRFVLLGEETHGTADFYRMRAEISRRLIVEQGFDAISIEGDWPDVWRVNRFVLGEGDDTAKSALADFERFPTWMWRNREVLKFITWLRAHNERTTPDQRVGIYGLDLYSLYRSSDAVINYLDEVDPQQAQVARARYAALDHVREPQTYGYQVASGQREPAHDGVVAQLVELRADAASYIEGNDLAAKDAYFFADRNAAVVVRAETYYRSMFGGRVNTWNLRDSHVGDARATEMHGRGELNLGQLMRKHSREATLLVGFTTYTGHVSAASEWNGDVEYKTVLPALPDSYEYLFHTTGLDRFFLPLISTFAEPLHEPLLERAIGVLYLPESERASHCFYASIARQFDVLFHLDETDAVEPIRKV
ncbi:MAG TPA: erythromycin esterase family protein [Candidatus Nanopelagicaceae bacterium]|nr:erythromycin esterase family protein [Candidatus Nanopelagicaceae bacterium]